MNTKLTPAQQEKLIEILNDPIGDVIDARLRRLVNRRSWGADSGQDSTNT